MLESRESCFSAARHARAVWCAYALVTLRRAHTRAARAARAAPASNAVLDDVLQDDE